MMVKWPLRPSILAQAARGRLPTQLTTAGLAYEAEITSRAAASAVDLQTQIEELQRDVSALRHGIGRLDTADETDDTIGA